MDTTVRAKHLWRRQEHIWMEHEGSSTQFQKHDITYIQYIRTYA
jgi:hypothetical protein